MGLNLSPDPIWDLVLGGLAWFMTAYVFIFWPLAYFLLGRPFDKKFEIKYYTIEKDTWFIGPGIRLVHYTAGIVLQTYRDKRIKNKIWNRVVTTRFQYQDMMYGKVVDYRKEATKVQIIISYIMWVGAVLIVITGILVLSHDFILYPEVGRANLSDNHNR